MLSLELHCFIVVSVTFRLGARVSCVVAFSSSNLLYIIRFGLFFEYIQVGSNPPVTFKKKLAKTRRIERDQNACVCMMHVS
jgi:hypothetical protein